MLKTITLKQINLLKENIDKMSRSEEQFILLIFKNLDGTDNVTRYSWNMIPEKLKHYLKEAINSAEIREEAEFP